MNKNQYESLIRYEEYFNTAVYGNYIRSISKNDIQSVASIYEAMGFHSGNLHCDSCVFRMFKNIGKLFYEYRQKASKKASRGSQKINNSAKNSAE